MNSKIALVCLILLGTSCGGSKESSQSITTPQTPQTTPEVEKIEPMIIKVNFTALLNIFHQIVPVAHAAEEVPYCENNCTSASCVYLTQVNEDGSEEDICKTDYLGGAPVEFKLYNKHLLKNSYLKVRTDEYVTIDSPTDLVTPLEEKNIELENYIIQKPFISHFKLDLEDIQKNRKDVQADKAQSILNESDSDMNPEQVMTFIMKEIFERDDYNYNKNDFYLETFNNAHLYEDKDFKSTLKKLIKNAEHGKVGEMEIEKLKEYYGVKKTAPTTENEIIIGETKKEEAPADDNKKSDESSKKMCEVQKATEKSKNENLKLIEVCSI